MSGDARVTARQRRGLAVSVAALAVAVLLPLAVLLGTAFSMGWKFQPIETGSMAPRYPAGSLAIIEPLEAADVRPGMTIVFEDPFVRGRLVAHRVVKRLPGRSPVWQTKGDSNTESDPAPVHSTAIKGRVRWAVPGLGRVVSALDGRWAVALLVGVPIAILLLSEITAVGRRRTKARRARSEPVGGASP
jgi:signal peptidase I